MNHRKLIELSSDQPDHPDELVSFHRLIINLSKKTIFEMSILEMELFLNASVGKFLRQLIMSRICCAEQVFLSRLFIQLDLTQVDNFQEFHTKTVGRAHSKRESEA